MTRNSRVFVIAGRFDQADFSNAFRGLALKIEAPTAANPFDILDSHDQFIRAGGQALIEVSGTLRLLQGDGEFLEQACSGKGKFVQGLPDGPVRAALNRFPKLRALMRIGGGTLETSAFAAQDDAQKTQVRGRVVSLSSRDGQATILSVQPVRGHDRAFKSVCAALVDLTDGSNDVEPVFRGLLPGAVPYKAKPEVTLGTDEPSIEVAVDIIRTYLSVARQNEAGVVADIDTEFLHDYRVSLRRIRSVLSLFRGVFSPEQTAALKREFSDLMAATGRVRDLDVILLEKYKYYSMLPPDLHLGAEALLAQFGTQRSHAYAGLTRHFRSTDYEQRMSDLSALFSEAGNLQPGPNAERDAYHYACALIWKRYRKLCKRARRITTETPDAAVHKLRIDCKKLRYLMEFFAPLFDRKTFRKLIRPLKKLQDNLGLFNDYSVQQAALSEFVADQSNTRGKADAKLAMSVGGLITVLSQRQEAERDRVITTFQHFDSPDIQHMFRSLFHRKAG